MKKTRPKPISDKRRAEGEDEIEVKRLCCERANGHFVTDGVLGQCIATVCEICGKFPDRKDGRGLLHFSHTIPKSQGGKTTVENCQWICRKCHNTKRHGIKEVDSKPQWSKRDE